MGFLAGGPGLASQLGPFPALREINLNPNVFQLYGGFTVTQTCRAVPVTKFTSEAYYVIWHLGETYAGSPITEPTKTHKIILCANT